MHSNSCFPPIRLEHNRIEHFTLLKDANSKIKNAFRWGAKRRQNRIREGLLAKASMDWTNTSTTRPWHLWSCMRRTDLYFKVNCMLSKLTNWVICRSQWRQARTWKHDEPSVAVPSCNHIGHDLLGLEYYTLLAQRSNNTPSPREPKAFETERDVFPNHNGSLWGQVRIGIQPLCHQPSAKWSAHKHGFIRVTLLTGPIVALSIQTWLLQCLSSVGDSACPSMPWTLRRSSHHKWLEFSQVRRRGDE